MAKRKKIKWDPDTGPAENAGKRLPKIAEDYFAEVRKVLAENPAPEEMHPLRLASKRFRYTLELFRNCYAAGLEERIDRLKSVQDLLGDCNDAVVSALRLEKAVRSEPAERERVRKNLDAIAQQKADEFRKQWVKSFDAPGQEKWWT